MSEFVHLHLHTNYSLLDATIRIDELVERVLALGQPAVAVTEHGNLYSTPCFYRTARARGLKPIVGCEIYVTPGKHTDRSPQMKRSNHLVLLVENLVGLKNLIKLVSKAHLDGFYYRPRCDHDLLEEFSEGLVCLSACLSGEVPSAILENKFSEAERIADWHRSVFKDRYYLEIQHNGLERQEKVNEGILKISQRLDIPLVATNDCHYLFPRDAKSHDVLLCIGTGKKVAETARKKYESEGYYLRSSEEMAKLFSDTPEAVKNTLEIAERCNLEWEFGGFLFPGFEVPEEKTLESTLVEMAREGLKGRLKKIKKGFPEKALWKSKKAEYEKRLELELDLITERGFAGYLLIVQDFMAWARDHDIPVGPGRGSAAGSLVCYSLGITDIDPIRYGLLFERFMNPERQDNPDIDCDFCAFGRDRVIEYVTEKYGKDNVCQIATFGKLRAKAVVRDVGRALGFPYADVDKVAKLIPNDLNITIDEAIKKDSAFRQFIEQNAWAGELIEFGRALEGHPRNIGKHAGGVVISPEPLTRLVPCLIKFDFLGLKNLTIIDKALGLIEKSHGLQIDMNEIPMDDKKTFELLASGHTTGVFQLESPGMKELLIRIAPETIDEVIANVALYRPGPMKSGMLDDYIAGKKGKKKVVYELPVLEEHLKETYGMMVYQEQVMQVATAVGGFSLGMSDLLRRAISKKKTDQMDKFKSRFLEGAKKKKIPQTKAKRIWDLMEKFGEYGFNKSHSAAYGVVAYQTAFLKANYPLEYMAALLTMNCGASDKQLAAKINEVREMGFEVLPPEVNRSEHDFTVEDGKIRFGLAGVKNVGETAIGAIIKARKEHGEFDSLHKLVETVDQQQMNKRVVESLVRAGCFDAVNKNRAQLLACVDPALEHAHRVLREKEIGQGTLFGGGSGASKKNDDRFLPDVPVWTENEFLENEKLAFGFYLTGHPLRQYAKIINNNATHTCETMKDLGRRTDVKVAGVISQRKYKDTARGRMAILAVEDLTGSFEAVVYNDAFERTENLLRSEQPLIFVGKAESTEEKGPKIYVDDVFLLSEADKEKVESSFHIQLPQTGVTKSIVASLGKILSRADRGNVRCVLHVFVPGSGEARMELGDKFELEPNERLVSDIEELLGPGAVMFS